MKSPPQGHRSVWSHCQRLVQQVKRRSGLPQITRYKSTIFSQAVNTDEKRTVTITKKKSIVKSIFKVANLPYKTGNGYNQSDVDLEDLLSYKWYNEIQPFVCKIKVFWATKHAQTTKYKLFWHLSVQKEESSDIGRIEPTYIVVGQPITPRDLICKMANQPHIIKPQKS